MSKVAVDLGDLMHTSGVRFGTSGARGLVSAMTDQLCYSYAAAFIEHLNSLGFTAGPKAIALGGDLRPSTERMMAAIGRAVTDFGYDLVYAGALPTPALTYYGISHQIPTIMVTGSHIPADRNGIKFSRPDGEITKKDEESIKQQRVWVEADLFDRQGTAKVSLALPELSPEAAKAYVARYLGFFSRECLRGQHIGLYEHSSVGRDLTFAILTGLGARVTRLARSDHFIPVDTEAIRASDVSLAKRWASQHHFDAIVSADGDADRPLVSDESGEWLRGDVAGILCAAHLQADAVAAPVSCNTALEKCGRFPMVARTAIGSPFVIEQMKLLAAQGFQRVMGFEANGGFMTHSPVRLDGKTLPALPTRDAVIVITSILRTACAANAPISALLAQLPSRFTASDRIENLPAEQSKSRLAALHSGTPQQNSQAVAALFPELASGSAQMDTTDGLRITLANEEIIHLRPSGNAPELRCYTEADTRERAKQLLETCLLRLTGWRTPG
jgi:phosphomannomutase